MEMSELPDGWRSCRLADITLPYKTRDPLKQPEDSFTYIDLSSVDNEVGRIVSPKILPGVADHDIWVSGTSGDAERAEKPVAQAHLVALVTRISKSRLYAE